MKMKVGLTCSFQEKESWSKVKIQRKESWSKVKFPGKESESNVKFTGYGKLVCGEVYREWKVGLW